MRMVTPRARRRCSGVTPEGPPARPSCGVHSGLVDYDPTQFSGTAKHYRQGRPPYSAQLCEVLARELGLDGSGHLLDVGTGPGTLGVQLAPLFARVTLSEPDADMLAEAKAYALRPVVSSHRPGAGRGGGLRPAGTWWLDGAGLARRDPSASGAAG